MDARCVGSVLFVLAYPGVPIALILAPRVRKLWTAHRGRTRALEELVLTLGILLAPALFLTGMAAAGLAPQRDDGWLLQGLFVGVPLWAVAQLLLRLAPGLIVRVRRLARLSRTGDGDGGEPLDEISGYLLPLVTAVLGLMLTLLALEISLDPGPIG